MWLLLYLLIIPAILIRTTEVAHHIVDVAAAFCRGSVQGEHSSKHRRHLHSTTAGIVSVPRTVYQVPLRS